MAHFAELDENNVVVSVTVVDNSHVPSDKHIDGETWCKNFFNQPDTTFKQTSYNDNFRKQYAGIGDTYDATKDKFIPPQPSESYTWNDSTGRWDEPAGLPVTDGKSYVWWESEKKWVERADDAPCKLCEE